MTHCYQLSINEREEISLGLAQGLSKNYIALSLGRSSSTICREVNRNTASRQAYRAVKAQGRANKLRHLARKSRKMDINIPPETLRSFPPGSIMVSGTDCQTPKNIVS